MHAARGQVTDPNFVTIGNPDLIDKRARRAVPLPPGGTLSDYVPFYFTPKSPMLLNIKTGFKGMKAAAERRYRDPGFVVSAHARTGSDDAPH